mmetsp:Transcript_68342/g.199948  ORF Transcript_68342/g.199948 Transcript_68342/m.199948 type:complete len:459 (-) Transcript_68342:87-1463(-)
MAPDPGHPAPSALHAVIVPQLLALHQIVVQLLLAAGASATTATATSTSPSATATATGTPQAPTCTTAVMSSSTAATRKSAAPASALTSMASSPLPISIYDALFACDGSVLPSVGNVPMNSDEDHICNANVSDCTDFSSKVPQFDNSNSANDSMNEKIDAADAQLPFLDVGDVPKNTEQDHRHNLEVFECSDLGAKVPQFDDSNSVNDILDAMREVFDAKLALLDAKVNALREALPSIAQTISAKVGDTILQYDALIRKDIDKCGERISLLDSDMHDLRVQVRPGPLVQPPPQALCDAAPPLPPGDPAWAPSGSPLVGLHFLCFLLYAVQLAKFAAAFVSVLYTAVLVQSFLVIALGFIRRLWEFRNLGCKLLNTTVALASRRNRLNYKDSPTPPHGQEEPAVTRPLPAHIDTRSINAPFLTSQDLCICAATCMLARNACDDLIATALTMQLFSPQLPS